MSSSKIIVPDYMKPNEFKEEGVDHVNINILSTVPFSKIMDPGYIKTIIYPGIGKFSSVRSLWCWLKKDGEYDELKRLVSNKLHLRYQAIEKPDIQVPNFRAIIGYATWLKVSKYPKAIDDYVKKREELKLLSYSTKKDQIRMVTGYANIIIPIAEEIVQAKMEKREPCFDRFTDDKKSSRKYYLDKFLEQRK